MPVFNANNRAGCRVFIGLVKKNYFLVFFGSEGGRHSSLVVVEENKKRAEFG